MAGKAFQDRIRRRTKSKDGMRYLKTFEEIAIISDPASTAARSYLSECGWDLERTLGNCAFFAKDFYEFCEKEGIECRLAYLKQDESFAADEIEDHIVPILAGKMIDFVYTEHGVSRRTRMSNIEEALRRQTDPEITDLSEFEEKYSRWGYNTIEEISYEEAYSGSDAKCQTIDYPERIQEAIKIPIEIGDTILGGRFKNKKTVVKKIGKNAKGDITVNGKPLLKYRLMKESVESFEDDTMELLLPIRDMGLLVEILSGGGFAKWNGKLCAGMVRIFAADRKNPGSDQYSFDSDSFGWKSIEADAQSYVSYMTEELGYDFYTGYYIGDDHDAVSFGFKRVQIEKEDILEGRIPEKIKMISIGFAK
jgi:hypothetical protein